MAIHLNFIFAILALAIPPSLYATELSTICTSGQNCDIKTPYTTITNHSGFVANGNGIHIQATIGTFTNYGILSVSGAQQALNVYNGYVGHFINYGTFENLDKMGIWIDSSDGVSKVTNYGVMGSINIGKSATTLTLNNFGLIGAKGAHIEVKNGSKVLIQNYMVKISEVATAFNNFSKLDNMRNFSHLVISANNGNGVRFKDGDSKIILDFDKGFEFGAGYLFSKLVTDTSGNSLSMLNVDLSRLVPRSDIYYLTQSGNSFIVQLAPQYGAVGSLYKANIRTMNNFLTMSNSMIYPRKYNKSQNLQNSSLRASVSERGNPKDLRAKRSNHPPYENSVDSAFSLKSYESFAYQNESQNLQTRRIKRTNKRNYSRNLNNSSLRASEYERGNLPQNLAQSDNYYFILTPFVNHNYFFESGRYNLSGFDYGFLTAFSARVAESNSLGAHFMMSYGSLSDSSDKNFHISNLNLNLGVNYKLDLIWDMYVKARGDFFYFLNQVKTLTMREAIKPNNLGFGLSVAYGKDFDFKQGGILGIEGGLDYKALSANEVTLDSMSETYKKSLYNVLYVDLGISYAKYFGSFGFNANLGIKGNITANKLAKSKISLNNFNRSVDMVLDNDKVLGYANVALSYVLNARNFDMEFSLAYYGNYGDRVISNGGGVEWRVGW